MTPDEIALLDQVEQAVFVLEPDSAGVPRYVAFNSYALGHVQRDVADVVGKTIKDLFPGQYGEVIYQHHLTVLETAAALSYQSHLPLHGEEMQIEVTLRPILTPEGQVRRIVGTTKDISSLSKLKDLSLDVEMFQSEIEDFVNLAAHDLRTPIRHVSMIAEMLREDFTDLGDGKLELIDMLEQIGTRAMTMIADILSHAQATSTQSDIRKFNFEDLVREVVGLFDPLGACKCHISGGWLDGDRAATLIVLRNLVDNAMKHARGPDLDDFQLWVSLAPDSPGFIRIEVRDNGPGLKDPSVVLLNTGTLRTEGGFGLLGVRRLVQTRGGQIEAENAADGGAVIRFTLPGEILDPNTDDIDQLKVS
ncbi:sensor histidine kinase [Tritonibacter horizontis]|uniref:histidine kinase n=1 Tax=Tritonibacter horizontis TaxID=1768241 RepID=A0A132BWR2_9RHOB|nr:PAS domain-containing sensor histidine kinase [Tritonibacter horizontis]KUP92811.1 phytochrome-like protein cph1 [Tritonibacter horizontis]